MISWPSIGNETCSASMIRFATAIDRLRSPSSMSSTANSSPPSRAARSSAPDAALDPLGDRAEEAVAGRVAQGVVHDLEVVEVEEQDDGDRARAGMSASRAFDLLGEHRPVREAGQRVVVGLVAELLLEPRQLGQRLLELAVLERDRGLVGERLEQPQVVVVERGPLGQPVGDGHRADHPGLAEERADHRLADRQAGRGVVGRRAPEERPALRLEPARDRVVEHPRRPGPSPPAARRGSEVVAERRRRRRG